MLGEICYWIFSTKYFFNVLEGIFLDVFFINFKVSILNDSRYELWC